MGKIWPALGLRWGTRHERWAAGLAVASLGVALAAVPVSVLFWAIVAKILVMLGVHGGFRAGVACSITMTALAMGAVITALGAIALGYRYPHQWAGGLYPAPAFLGACLGAAIALGEMEWRLPHYTESSGDGLWHDQGQILVLSAVAAQFALTGLWLLLRRRGDGRFPLEAGLGAVGVMALLTSVVPFRDFGCALVQPVEAALCVYLIVLLVPGQRGILGVILIALVGLGTELLVQQAIGNGWSATPRRDSAVSEALADAYVVTVRATLVNVGPPWSGRAFQKGPISPQLLRVITESAGPPPQYILSPEWSWATPVTGLYRMKPERIQIWYPGGAVRAAAQRVELRRWPRKRTEK